MRSDRVFLKVSFFDELLLQLAKSLEMRHPVMDRYCLGITPIFYKKQLIRVVRRKVKVVFGVTLLSAACRVKALSFDGIQERLSHTRLALI